MRKSLEGHTALITGSSRGIGKVIATTLAREGADIIICGKNQPVVEETKREIQTLGGIVYGYCLDGTKTNEVDNIFHDITKNIGKLDILVNNIGGVSIVKKFLDLSDDEWYEAWNLNFMTMVRFSRGAMPLLLKSRNGSIVNISSIPGRQPGLTNPQYGAAKAAMNYLSKYIANSFAAEGIRVNAILPSTVMGGLWDTHVTNNAKRFGISMEEAQKTIENEVKEKTPLGKIAMPEDIAELTLFLVSDRSRFITGTCIAVDGGIIKSIF